LTCCRQTVFRAEDVFHGKRRAFTNDLETETKTVVSVRARVIDVVFVLSACVAEY